MEFVHFNSCYMKLGRKPKPLAYESQIDKGRLIHIFDCIDSISSWMYVFTQQPVIGNQNRLKNIS